MTATNHYERIAAHDGGSFDAYCAIPVSGKGPGIILFQEIFGINDNMRGLADRLAAEGYVVLVPDMFWRIEPRFERKDESTIGEAFAVMMQFDAALGSADIAATHLHLHSMAQCSGKVGAVGFCLGGALTFNAAATSKADGHGIDAAVCYYGSGINDMLALAGSITCPTMYHYGSNDAFIPEANIDAVEAAVAGRPGVEFHRYDAGHAFSNWDAPSMYNEAAATQAWNRTLTFFATNLR